MQEEKKVNAFQAKGKVKVVKGSILAPQNGGLRFVLNINNTAGKADGAWYKVYDKKWPKIKEQAKGWYNTRTGAYALGAAQTTALQSDVWAIHMLCQDDKGTTNVAGLEECLKKVSGMAKYEKSTVHVSSLLIEAVPELNELLSKHLVDNGISVYFYEEPK